MNTMILNTAYTKSPANLHRIPTDIRTYPEESLTSKIQLIKHLKKCEAEGTLPDVTVVEGYVSLYGNNYCADGKKGAMGISTFIPIDESDDAFRAAHDLHHNDGTRLRCCVFPQNIEIAGHGFLYDRDIKTCTTAAKHVLIYPTIQLPTLPTLDLFNSIANCQYPSDTWQLCTYAGASGEYEEPCFPDDPIFRIALGALECVALDTELPGNVRMHGRLYQYCISEMQWSDLDASADFYFLAVLLLALLKIYPKINDAHDLATITGAVHDLSYWLSALGDTNYGDMQVKDGTLLTTSY